MLREAFRDAIEHALARRPIITPRGHVARDPVAVRMGSPGGTHGELSTWVYARTGTALEMIVGFFELFTPDDVICKVVPAGAYPRSDEGASIQLNADRCLVLADGGIQLVHHGRVCEWIDLPRSAVRGGKRALPRRARRARPARRVLVAARDRLVRRRAGAAGSPVRLRVLHRAGEALQAPAVAAVAPA